MALCVNTWTWYHNPNFHQEVENYAEVDNRTGYFLILNENTLHAFIIK